MSLSCKTNTVGGRDWIKHPTQRY